MWTVQLIFYVYFMFYTHKHSHDFMLARIYSHVLHPATSIELTGLKKWKWFKFN